MGATKRAIILAAGVGKRMAPLSYELPKALLTPVEGTYLAWVDLRAYSESCDLLERKFREHGVVLTGGSFFGPEGEGFMRVNFGCPAAQMLEWISPCGVRAAYTVIPNLAIEVGESMTFIQELCGTPETLATVRALFDAVGKTDVVDERRLKAGMMLASCGTAFALRYVRASAEGGVYRSRLKIQLADN